MLDAHDDRFEAATFDRARHEFRQARPWLRRDLTDGETFDYRHPTDGPVVYYGHRTAPDGWELVVESHDAEVTVAD